MGDNSGQWEMGSDMTESDLGWKNGGIAKIFNQNLSQNTNYFTK
jgi:hypothetical protein